MNLLGKLKQGQYNILTTLKLNKLTHALSHVQS